MISLSDRRVNAAFAQGSPPMNHQTMNLVAAYRQRASVVAFESKKVA
jgi:hypothetical protein